MHSYNDAFGALITAPSKPAPIATGEWPGQPCQFNAVRGTEVICVWWYYTYPEGQPDQPVEAWAVEVYADSPERVQAMREWVLTCLRDTLGEAMTHDEDGEPVGWPEGGEEAVAVMYTGGLLTPQG